ncbi:MAG: AlpA family phage regulatory protein [Proteobacteria bacterium]|nr:AlpA family phage regulatory protein [Pseudomonadota bacterium]
MTNNDNVISLSPAEAALDGLPERLLSARELGKMLGCSRASLDRYEKADSRFPRRIHLSPQKCGWRLTEAMAFIEAKEADAAA